MTRNTTGGIPKEVLVERERQIWALRQQLYTHQRIADALGLDRSTVSKTIRRLTARARKQLAEEMADFTVTQVEQLEYIADEAMQAWHRSKEAQKTATKRSASRPGKFGKSIPTGEEVTVRNTDADGNPRYLDSAMKAMGEIRKVLGLDAPQRLELTNPLDEAGKPIPFRTIDYRADLSSLAE